MLVAEELGKTQVGVTLDLAMHGEEDLLVEEIVTVVEDTEEEEVVATIVMVVDTVVIVHPNQGLIVDGARDIPIHSERNKYSIYRDYFLGCFDLDTVLYPISPPRRTTYQISDSMQLSALRRSDFVPTPILFSLLNFLPLRCILAVSVKFQYLPRPLGLD